jgi:hypothetical protein
MMGMTHYPRAIVWPENEFEVTVTLKVGSDDLEDVVARTFADPHCVDVRVHSATSVACRSEETNRAPLRQQASQGRKL